MDAVTPGGIKVPYTSIVKAAKLSSIDKALQYCCHHAASKVGNPILFTGIKFHPKILNENSHPSMCLPFNMHESCRNLGYGIIAAKCEC